MEKGILLSTEASSVEQIMQAHELWPSCLEGDESPVQIRHAVSARDALKLSSSVILKPRVRASACDAGSVMGRIEGSVVLRGVVCGQVTSFEASDSIGSSASHRKAD